MNIDKATADYLNEVAARYPGKVVRVIHQGFG